MSDKLLDMLALAKSMGADAADALYVQGRSVGVQWRDGKLESLEHSEGHDIGLRVFFGHRQASVATSDHSPKALRETVERAVAMARAVPEDPFCGIAAPDEISRTFPDLDLADDYAPDVDALIVQARACEDAARSVKGVMATDSAGAAASETTVTLAASNGFRGTTRRTNYVVSVSVIAGEGTAMESDSDYDSRTHRTDLRSPEEIGLKAGREAVRRLNPRKMPTCRVPVIFDPQESNSLLGSFVGAITGSAVARGTSFLKDFLGKPIFPDTIQIIDDPFMPRGPRSKAFDGEGLAPRRRAIVENGTLTTWLMDLRSARQLGLKSTGHASRGTTGTPSPSPTNFFMGAGALSPADLIKDIESGFYVTQLMGQGVNGVTGDFSQSAKGFWIEKGQIAYPVSEMTIAANLKDMFRNLTAASDLTHRYGIDAPTLRIEGMTVAGQ